MDRHEERQRNFTAEGGLVMLIRKNGRHAVRCARRFPLLLILGLVPSALIFGYTGPVIAQTIQINFQPSNVAVPPGFLPDGGRVYGDRGNGYSYGWDPSHTGNTYYYEPFPWTPNPYWSNIFMKAGSATKWELAVSNGTYEVSISAGGWLSANQLQRITAEDVVVVDGTGDSYSPWVGGTATVTVSDGKLTVKNGPVATHNSICFIRITRQ